LKHALEPDVRIEGGVDFRHATIGVLHDDPAMWPDRLCLLQDITVGYGYRPRRALGWLALLLIAGSIVFSVAPPPALQAGNAPHFNGAIYTLDLMLPVVNLGQKYAFNPGGAEQWLSYVLIAAGWTLATTVAAGVARVLRRG
jgi:hypothetical protein